jgi:beta-glucosidase
MKMKLVIFGSLLLVLSGCYPGKKNREHADSSPGFPFQDPALPLEQRLDDLTGRLTLEEKASQMVYFSAAVPRLDIPAYNWWNECLHGVARAGEATIFPQPIGMAATFDEDLIFQIAGVISDEARAKYNLAVAKDRRGKYQGLTFWSPNINIFRDPRWGRGMETWGEDPYLTGVMASAFVKGLRGDHPRYLKTAACAKHFAVHSGPEKERHHFNARVSEKDLYETYLPAFRDVVTAGVDGIMCAYNRTNDEPCCGSPRLLSTILREELGFQGHILTDCGAVNDINLHHKVTASTVESVALAVKNGVGLDCGVTFLQIPEAVQKGLVSEAEVDRALRPLLETRFRLGLFDPPAMNPYNAIPASVIHCTKHRQLSRKAAVESIVLLKNRNNLLPLSKDIKSVFVTGPIAADADVLLGNYYGMSDELVTFLEGFIGKVEQGISLRYWHGVLLNQPNIRPPKHTWFAKEHDLTIAFLGMSPLLEGEEEAAIASPGDGDRFDLTLPEGQMNYLRKLRESAGQKPIVVVLTGGGPLELAEVYDLADAVLFAWYPGEQGGNAVADILFGDAVPSGRLPVTFPMSAAQLPDFDNYSMDGRTYRYMKEESMVPFGFGLSYTTFSYSDLRFSKERIYRGETFSVIVKVKNTGKKPGDEVVQLYVSDPEVTFRNPNYSLKGIRRVHLAPGEEKDVSFSVSPAMFESVNESGRSVLSEGRKIISIGGSSPHERSLKLGAPAFVEKTFKIEERI